MRISGTMASLAGLEQALDRKDEQLIEYAIRRINMLYGVLCSIGGIPLIFLGEEWGMLNDYDYVNDPGKMEDSRWVHRPRMNWILLEEVKKKNIPCASASSKICWWTLAGIGPRGCRTLWLICLPKKSIPHRTK